MLTHDRSLFLQQCGVVKSFVVCLHLGNAYALDATEFFCHLAEAAFREQLPICPRQLKAGESGRLVESHQIRWTALWSLLVTPQHASFCPFSLMILHSPGLLHAALRGAGLLQAAAGLSVEHNHTAPPQRLVSLPV